MVMSKFLDRFDKPEDMLLKEPFTRGGTVIGALDGIPVEAGTMVAATPPTRMLKQISQATYLKELDPSMHDINFDENVPKIVAKVGDGFMEVKYIRMALAYQAKIVEKQTQYLCGKKMRFTLCNHKPKESEKDLFINLKEKWLNRNMDIRKWEVVYKQKSVGDSAWIFYFDDEKQINSKTVSYMDNYTLLPHRDRYGKLDFFAMYFMKDGQETIEAYDKVNRYVIVKTTGNEYRLIEVTAHGFDRLPVVYKRGQVAWENAQSIIETTEIIYNIYTVIMKRHGWGLLYIRGKLDPKITKTAGAIILNDPNPDSNGTAEFKSPPSPDGMENLIADLRKQIQWQTSTLFLHPDDIKMSSEPSGIAIKLLLNTALEKASTDARDYDEVADEACQLFKYGLGIEEGKITEYNSLNIRAEFDVWMPQSETEIVNNIVQLKSAKAISNETAAEISPLSAADETARISTDKVIEEAREDEIASKVGVSLTKVKTKGAPKNNTEINND